MHAWWADVFLIDGLVVAGKIKYKKQSEPCNYLVGTIRPCIAWRIYERNRMIIFCVVSGLINLSMWRLECE